MAAVRAIAKLTLPAGVPGTNFHERQRGNMHIPVSSDPGWRTGLYLYELVLRVGKLKFDHWVDWAPTPNCAPTEAELDDAAGNIFFMWALGWIVRHELAHIVLNHHSKATAPKDAEQEADLQATNWIKGVYKADAGGAPGTLPSDAELELERRAIGACIGLLWVSQFECVPHAASQTHPPAAERLFAVVERFELADDSFAAEATMHAIKILLDPEGKWPDAATATEGLIDALIRLHRHITGNMH